MSEAGNVEPVALKLGDFDLALKFDKRAKFRLSKSGLTALESVSQGFAFICEFLAATNQSPATRHLKGEDIADMLPEDEAELKAIGETITETIRRAQTPGKPRRKG